MHSAEHGMLKGPAMVIVLAATEVAFKSCLTDQRLDKASFETTSVGRPPPDRQRPPAPKNVNTIRLIARMRAQHNEPLCADHSAGPR